MVALLLAGGGASVPARAEGFRSPTIGTSGLAGSGGRRVFIDDASAISHNPANLVELDRWEASAEPTFVHHEVEYRSSTGATAHTEKPWKLLPHFFAGGPVVKDKVAAGLGVTVPYGLSVDWGDGGAFHYTAPHYVDLKCFNFNPTVAFRITPTLSVGVGADIMWSRIDYRQYYPWSLVTGIPGLPDGEVRVEGDDTSCSGNVAITWDFLPRHRLMASVRAPMDATYDGSIEVTHVPTQGGATVDTPLRTEIDFPTVVAVGYGFAFSPRWHFEVNAEWVQFSRFESLALETAQPLPGLPQKQVHNWDDTFTVGAGARWDLDEHWRFWLSYQYFESPVPDATFSPGIPDSDQHTVTLGVRYQCGRHRVEAAYAPVFYLDRDIQNDQSPAYNGKYTFNVHLVSVAYGFSF